MTARNTTSSPLLDTIRGGILLLEEGRPFVEFRLLSGNHCLIGPLLLRDDWQDEEGRPGVMPVLRPMKSFGGAPVSDEELCLAQELLNERMNSSNMFMFEHPGGWVLTSMNNRKLA